jgi:para-nitrobenzyl esterase
VSSYWVNFTKTGNPNGPSLPEWPRYVPDEPTVLRMDADAFSAVDLPFRERLELLGAAMDNDILVRKPRTSN